MASNDSFLADERTYGGLIYATGDIDLPDIFDIFAIDGKENIMAKLFAIILSFATSLVYCAAVFEYRSRFGFTNELVGSLAIVSLLLSFCAFIEGRYATSQNGVNSWWWSSLTFIILPFVITLITNRGIWIEAAFIPVMLGFLFGFLGDYKRS